MKLTTRSRILLTVLILGGIGTGMAFAFMYWANGFYIMGTLLFLLAVALLVWVWVPWDKVFKSKKTDAAQTSTASKSSTTSKSANSSNQSSQSQQPPMSSREKRKARRSKK